MTTTRRQYLEQRLDDLNLGYLEEADQIDDDTFETMVLELEAAGKAGTLDFETNAGIETLATIINKALDTI